jgi:hypothetical protein
MKTIVVVLILGALAYWGYRHGYIKPAWFGGLGGATSSPAGAPGESIEKALNRGLPRMLNNEVSVDRAVANNQRVGFDYRFIELDQYAVAQRYGSAIPAELRGAMIRDVCANRDVREQVLARGRDVTLQVHALDGRTMFSAQLRPGDC